MSILIQINPPLETRLREKAAVKGLTLNQFITQFLESNFSNNSVSQPSVSAKEATLLQQVNLDISSEKWDLYINLKEKRQKKSLSKAENKEYLSLIEEIELANARRISVLAELAQIRNVSIRVLMEQLGIALNHE